MNTNVKTVCCVITAQSDLKIYTILMLIYNWSLQLSYKIENSKEMPNSCFTMYIFHTDVLTYLPIQHSQAFAYLHTANIKTFISVN